MRFSFYEPGRAMQFAKALRDLGLPGTVKTSRGIYLVTTHSRCLDHAAELKQYLGGGAQ
jgi:hypothetical protein